MSTPYSLDFRVRILKDYDSGVPFEDIVAYYAVSRFWNKKRRHFVPAVSQILQFQFVTVAVPFPAEPLLPAERKDSELVAPVG